MDARHELIKYDEACKAVAQARTTYEAKKIRDTAVAMVVYAKQAKNKNMEADAVEIRMRATRRLDQLRLAQKETVGLATGGDATRTRVGKKPESEKPTLASQGIDKNLAHQARVLGAMSEHDFEKSITRSREAVQRVVKIESDRNRRMAKIEEISAGNSALLIGRRYPIVYADPPWRYENPPIGATDRAIENHYPTMTLDEICALPVDQLAAEDAMLYLWATAPKLAECMKVIEAWGFEYRTNMVWDKEKIGLGYHVRNQHELLLIAKRGEIPPPKAGTQPSSVYRELRGKHSVKPEFFYEMIEAFYPGMAKIELFARSARDGWATWGNQAMAAE